MFNKIIELINAIKKPKHKLTNLDISDNYRNIEIWLFKKDLTSAFAYWVVLQSPYDVPDIMPALIAYDNYLTPLFHNNEIPIKFNYETLKPIVSECLFKSIPEILELNNRKNGREGMGFCSRYDKPDPNDDFIDLGALSRNIFYMILRNHITQAN